MRPTLASIVACAIDPATSCLYSRRSYEIDSTNDADSASVASEMRDCQDFSGWGFACDALDIGGHCRGKARAVEFRICREGWGTCQEHFSKFLIDRSYSA